MWVPADAASGIPAEAEAWSREGGGGVQWWLDGALIAIVMRLSVTPPDNEE